MGYLADSEDVAAAKADFAAAFAAAEAGEHASLQGAPVVSAYLADSEDVAAAKVEFAAAFAAAEAGEHAALAPKPVEVPEVPAAPALPVVAPAPAAKPAPAVTYVQHAAPHVLAPLSYGFAHGFYGGYGSYGGYGLPSYYPAGWVSLNAKEMASEH